MSRARLFIGSLLLLLILRMRFRTFSLQILQLLLLLNTNLVKIMARPRKIPFLIQPSRFRQTHCFVPLEVVRFWSLLIKISVVHGSEVANDFVYLAILSQSTLLFDLLIDSLLENACFLEDFYGFDQLSKTVQAHALKFKRVKHDLSILAIFGTQLVCSAAHVDRYEIVFRAFVPLVVLLQRHVSMFHHLALQSTYNRVVAERGHRDLARGRLGFWFSRVTSSIPLLLLLIERFFWES